MDDHPQIVAKSDGDALADSSQFTHHLTLNCRDRRLRGAQYEPARHTDRLQGTADDARFEGAEVGIDVGKLGHMSCNGDYASRW